MPRALKAQPPSSEVSAKVPSRRFVQSWFGETVVAHVEVGPAVAVEVVRHDAQRAAVRRRQAGSLRDVLEAPVAAVVQQPVGLRLVAGRSAVVAHGRAGPAVLVEREREADVVADEEVQPAVAVHVEEGGRRAEAAVARAGRGRHVRERAVAGVAQQLVLAEVRHVEVDVAVVVDVPGRDAHAVAGRDDPGRVGHVREAQRALLAQEVAEEPVAGRVVRRRRTQGGRRVAVAQHVALHEVGVQVAVTVRVEEGASRSERLAEVELAGHPVEVHEVEPDVDVDALEHGRVVRRGRRLTTAAGEDQPGEGDDERQRDDLQADHGPTW